MNYRNLHPSEIEILEGHDCQCEDWDLVMVKDGFNPNRIKKTQFSGKIKIGVLEKDHLFSSGIRRPSSVSGAFLHNCIIGDNVYIHKIRNHIANYNIGDETVIENVDIIEVTEKSSFGNGVHAKVLNETGGREVPVFDYLSAHLAYIIALYRYRPKLIERLYQMIDEYAESVTSDMGTIGKSASIRNCQFLRNVRIGDSAVIEGVSFIKNASINSNEHDPVFLGCGIKIEDSIVSSGSKIAESVILESCFVGQGCKMGKHYSAENSLFFSNFEGYHGEACSIFAAPFTVTHHKSTLLIAGYFSFCNAGSGSNQSNHMYKLGPIHQGIMERGAKTTSDSYLLWPAKVGPFTLVMGRHYKNSDTSDLPFSYMIENKDESVLVPAINLKSVGTIRDAQKWPRRDRRQDPVKLDYINFNLLSPFTIRKMIAGRVILKHLFEISGERAEQYTFHNVVIEKKSLLRGIELYQIGINKFLGNSIIKRLENLQFGSDEEICKRLKPDEELGKGEWIDLAGLIAPQEAINDLLDRIENGAIKSLKEVNKTFKFLHKKYYDIEWTWAMDILEQEEKKSYDKFTATDVVRIVERWKDSVIGLDKMLYEDARKEFTLSKQTGFGADGDDFNRKIDFEQVRGDFEQHEAVAAIKEHMVKKEALGNELIGRLKHLVN
ncbi:DUF4954 family protein [Saccharicrinis sp. FJH62]|uniref:DUF4954 family protein n=1 Tax=Saccharicrinis sp. FJH62 TaxID=3344657 RepID=UPI0035D41ABD